MAADRNPDRDEVQAAFEHWWEVGNAGEDWAGWVELFTPDVFYLDHFWGPLHGHAEVDPWIHAVMKGVPEIYGVYEWHIIEGDRVVFHYQNRRDDPTDPDRWFDFAGLSVLTYAGDGLWSVEEDFWDAGGARRTATAYADACRRAGIVDSMDRLSRRHWGDGPAWARGPAEPRPSWLDRNDTPITRPSELRRLLDGSRP
jgi:hypothetical protein